ncbi:unnamed protein product, partial [Discosporangium mesarthrocarpum]
YLIFLGVFVAYIYVGRTSNAFYMNEAVTDRLIRAKFADRVTFLDISSPGQWFDWAEGVLIPALFPESGYDGESSP